VLRRDLADVVLDGCRVLTGVLLDPYGGGTIVFDSDRPEQVQVDHVVALADAWRKGAQQWTAQRRLEFANDPVNLLAVSG
ncbi:MAG TPA: HNH endonuclease family protein, partial [Actinotalea sp.]|nr:HNH endonuclease family protein [Actinotalea sp.]